MKRIRDKFARLLAERTAATAIEYGLIVSLIVIAMIGALQLLAGRTSEVWDYVANTVLAYS